MGFHGLRRYLKESRRPASSSPVVDYVDDHLSYMFPWDERLFSDRLPKNVSMRVQWAGIIVVGYEDGPVDFPNHYLEKLRGFRWPLRKG
jgi:hypothetical protein